MYIKWLCVAKCCEEAAQDYVETKGGDLALFEVGKINKCSTREVKFKLWTEERIEVNQLKGVGACE